MVGQTCFSPGEAKNTYGTGCFMLLNTGTEIVPSKSGLLTTCCYKFGDQPTIYALEGSIAITGALVQWLRDNLKLIQTALTWKAWLARSKTTAVSILCRPSRASLRPTGGATPGASSPA